VWVRHEANRGTAAARNTGACLSHGEYLIFLDSDDYFLPGRIASHMKVFEERPDVAWLYSDHLIFDGTGLSESNVSKPDFRPEGWVFEYLLLETNGFQLPIMAVTLRRQVFSEAGGFDEDLPYVEDLDFWLKVSKRHPIAYVPKAGVVWVDHDKRSSCTLPVRAFPWCKVLEHHASSKEFPRRTRRRLLRQVAILRRRATPLLHAEVYEYLLRGQTRRAWACLCYAIRYHPFRLKNYLYIPFACLSPSVYAAARNLKKKFWS
jgi:glycosyltransferase involved in cell wall biosynthesis